MINVNDFFLELCQKYGEFIFGSAVCRSGLFPGYCILLRRKNAVSCFDLSKK